MMKYRYLLAFAALAIPFCLSAKPAYRGLLKHLNPDGTTVEYRLHGDEYFSYMTDTDGMLLTRTADGSLVRRTEGGKPVYASAETLRGMRKAAGSHNNRHRMAPLDTDGRTKYNTIGETRALVLLLEYSDIKFQPASPQDIADMLNKPGYNKYGCNGSARDYYFDNSGGKFTPVFDVARVVTLPNTSKYYTGPEDNSKYVNFREAIKYALEELDAEIDYAKYDCDGDGVVDAVYIFYAGYGQADTPLDGQVIWPHQGWLTGYSFDGVRFGQYACSNELNGQRHYAEKDMYVDGPGTFIHEYGHVLGMPDIYDPLYQDDTVTVGPWDVMDIGCYNNEGYCPPNLSTYEKWVYRWIEYDFAASNTHYDLKSIQDGGTGLVIPVQCGSASGDNSEYFILESRSNTGWDTYIGDYYGGVPGLLVWHIDYNNEIWKANRVNSTPGHPGCFLVTADGTADPFKENVPEDYRYFPIAPHFPGKYNRTSISPDGEICLRTYLNGGAPMDVTISDIKYDDATRTSSFGYNLDPGSVGSIGSDPESVYGVKDAIVAPQGAEIYNLAGARVASAPLAPGVYLVRHQARVHKVTVR